MNQDDPSNSPAGDTRSHENLLAMVYEELRGLAAARMASQAPGHTLQPTALVHEAWMRLSKSDDSRWNSREHFFRAAAIAMRQILVDHARAKTRLKRSSDSPSDAVSLNYAESLDPESDVLIVHECLGSLEKSHPDCARVVQLKFFAGLNNQEAADVMGISLRSTERLWAFARAKLFELVSNGRDGGMS